MATIDQMGNVLPDTAPLEQLEEVTVTAQRPRFNWNGILWALAGALMAALADDMMRPPRKRRRLR
jgi:hypothetical protein